jgi:hypothetical protein
MCATISSWRSGATIVTSAPRARQNSTTRAVVAGAVPASGVTKQARSAKRSAEPCSQPVFSEPAIGWAPTKCARPAIASSPCRAISPLTLPTSVTVAPKGRWGAISRASGMIWSTGAAITTRSADRAASARDSAAASHQGWAARAGRISGRRAQITMRFATPRARAARATEPPSRPGATTVS